MNSGSKVLMVYSMLFLMGSSYLKAQDIVAENMLLFQRSYGGWPKHLDGKAINYNKTYSVAEKDIIKGKTSDNDATIDNNATTKEIRYLLKTYKQTGDKRYLAAAENGIRYLLKAQYKNGGWPQYYPDFSSYRAEITYNDNAMINVLRVLQDAVLKRNDLEQVSASLILPCAEAVKKGIDCILKTQVKVKGKPTVWCAQYDAVKLTPANARAFELVSLSGSESVDIVEFLMAQPNPSTEIKAAVKAAVEWFQQSKITGYNFIDMPDAAAPKGTDRKLVPKAGSTIWARFYDIETNEPFFCGRDGIKKKDVKDIEYERRNGYAWYGNWPAKLINKQYPKWLAANN